MALGQVIGRVAVKVVPDTSDFRRQLERQLNRIEKTLKPAALKVRLDEKSLSRQARQASKRVQRDLKEVAADTDLRLRPQLELEQRTARNFQAQIRRYLDDIPVRPELDPHAVNRVKRQIEDAFDRIETLKAQLHPSLNERERRRVERQIEDLADKISDLRASIAVDLDETSTRVTQGRLAWLSRLRVVTISPQVSKTAAAKSAASLAALTGALSGARVLHAHFDRLRASIGRLDQSVPLIGSLTLAVAGLAGWSLSAASNLFALSASLAQIGPSALVLPGLLGGIAIGVAATIAVLKDFNTVIPELGDQLAALQDRMSQRFWTVAEQPIRNLISVLLPQLAAGLETTATKLGGFFAKLAGSLTVNLDGLVGPMFADLAASIDIAATATDALARIIATLGRVGAGYLPRLAAWFASIAIRFDAWLTDVAQDGRLQRWIDQALFALSELGRVAVGIGSILAGLGRAASQAGGSSLTMMADTLERAARVVNGPEFQTALVGTLQAAHLAMSNIATQAGPAFQRLLLTLSGTAQTVLPIVGQAIGTLLDGILSALAQPAVQRGLTAWFEGLQQGINGLVPALAPVGAALGALATLAGTLARNLGPVLGAALTALAGVVQILAPALQPVVDLLGSTLQQVLRLLAPQLAKIATALAGLISPELLASARSLVDAVLPKLAEWLPTVANTVVQLLGAVAPLLPKLLQLATVVLPPLIQNSIDSAKALQPLIYVLAKLVELIALVLGPLTEFTEFLLGPFGLGLALGASQLTFFYQTGRIVLENLKTVFQGTFVTAIPGLVVNGLNRVRTAWNTVWDGIRGGATSLWAGLRTGLSAVMGAMQSDTTSRLSTLRSVWSTTWSSIRGTVTSAASAVASAVASAATAIHGAVTSAMGAVNTAVTNGLTAVVGRVRAFPGQAKAALGDLGRVLLAAGAALINGLIAGIDSKIGAVKGKLQSLTAMIPNWKGPRDKDAQLLAPAGTAIMDGLRRSMEAQYTAIRRSLQRLTYQIAKTGGLAVTDAVQKVLETLPKGTSTAVARYVVNVRNTLLGLGGMFDRVSDRLKAAQDRLTDLQRQAADYAANIRDRIVDTGDVTKPETDSFANIFASLVKARDAAQRFAVVLAKLKAAGLNKTALDQLAQAGPEAGLAAAEAILNAGQTGIKQINILQAQIAQAAAKAGKTAADAMFGHGLSIAKGLVDGLKRQRKAIQDQMVAIANAMVAAIKKALGIKSPSRVFARLGSQVGRGFTTGIRSEHNNARKALLDLAHINRGNGLNGTGGAGRGGVSVQVARAVAAALGAGGGSVQKVFNYYAAPGSSLSAEEELFAAAGRARMAW